MPGEAESLMRFVREHLEFPPESHIQIRLEDGDLVAECDACGARWQSPLRALTDSESEEDGDSGDSSTAEDAGS